MTNADNYRTTWPCDCGYCSGTYRQWNLEPSEDEPSAAWIYGITGADMVKFGRSLSYPTERLTALQTGSPVTLTLSAAISVPDKCQCRGRVAHMLERWVHAYCAPERRQREWFRLGPRSQTILYVMQEDFRPADRIAALVASAAHQQGCAGTFEELDNWSYRAAHEGLKRQEA